MRRKKTTPKKTQTHHPVRLSPTTGLNLFRECERCFFLHHKQGVHRPRGIFPSLPGGMDLVIKGYFDQFRGALPPELRGKVEGVLIKNQAALNQWRNWRTGLEYRDEQRNAVLFGALDDCMVADNLHVPLDYKTKGSAPHPGDGERYYQLQLDTYALLLKANGYEPANFAYLVYYFPLRVGAQGNVTFRVFPVRVSVDPERAKKTFEGAVDLLHGERIPERHSQCEYCSWNENLREFD